MKPRYFIGLCAVICLAIGIGLAIALLSMLRSPSGAPQVIVMPNIPAPSPTATSTTTVATSWVSPDGTKTLVMKTQPSHGGLTTYSFSVNTSATASGQVIYKKTVDAKTLLSIPFNAWSPDDKYFFIHEQTGLDIQTFVFKATGELFPDGQLYLDINALYTQKNAIYTLSQVTGWAAPTLLIINTKKADGTVGPSFWFDISRKALIRLTNSFP